MIREETIAVLRAIREHGPVTVKELDARKVHSAQSGCKPAVHALSIEHELIEVYDFSSAPLRYIIAAKGEKLLSAMDLFKAAQTGTIAEPRTSPPADPYTGERSTHHRPGSLDFLAAPSLSNGRQVERKRPALICACVEAVGLGRA